MVRGLVQEVQEVEKIPTAGVLMGVNAVGYTFVVLAVAAALAWLVFVIKADYNGVLGEEFTESLAKNSKGTVNLATADVCFQALVASILLYFVARHHFSHLHL
jgi:hypothetical protein